MRRTAITWLAFSSIFWTCAAYAGVLPQCSPALKQLPPPETHQALAEPAFHKPRLIGLTGGIASGKSTVAKLLAKEGIPSIAIDAVNGEVIDTDPGIHRWLIDHFGPGIMKEGKPDREKLRHIFYVEAEGKSLFEEYKRLLTPLVTAEVDRRIEAYARQGQKLVLIEDALLIESGRYRNWDGMLVVLASKDLQKTRMAQRDGARGAPDIADGILKRQISDDDRRKTIAEWNRDVASPRAFLLENAGTLDELGEKVSELVNDWRKSGWLDQRSAVASP